MSLFNHAACSCLLVGLMLAGTVRHVISDEGRWSEVVREARGQTVYFNAWGGDGAINRYIEWAARQLQDDHAITLRHVKVTDISEAVSRIRAESLAGRHRDGSVDLLWINGENFAALKNAGLLYGPWARNVPNAQWVDWEGNPTTRFDGALETGGYELPWGTATLTMFLDRERVTEPPRDPQSLLTWIEQHPGRFTYPQPPAFLGTAFLKQLLFLLAANPDRMQYPAGAEFDSLSAPLWNWLDRAHPNLWRKGRLFPRSGPAQRELLAVGELDWMLSYNPAEASRAIAQGEMHDTIGALNFADGALANSHFLAIAYNSSASAGAQVVANFLLSPLAQARKADERYWGDPTVFDLQRLAPAQRQLFETVSRGPATPAPAARYAPEPHPSWNTRLEQAWLERYSR